MKTQEENHTVWVNGTEVTKSFVSEDTALAIKFAFEKLGYEDVSIETFEESQRKNKNDTNRTKNNAYSVTCCPYRAINRVTPSGSIDGL